MRSDEAEEIVISCIKELKEEIKKWDNDEVYGWECDVHFDLYYLLNKKEQKFWQEKSVMAHCNEIGNTRIDLVIYDPDNKEEQNPLIAIELKFDERYYKKDKKSEPIGKDVKNLLLIKNKYPKLIAMEVYFGKDYKIDEIKDLLSRHATESGKIKFVIAHTDENIIYMNENNEWVPLLNYGGLRGCEDGRV